MTKDKLGLILEGGGVKGAYQAGAMLALKELGIEFDGVAGTSIGAINGALYLQGGFDKVLDVWKEVRLTTVFDFTDDEVQKFVDMQILPSVIEYVRRRRDEKGFLLAKSYEKAQKFFFGIVNEEKLRKSEKDFGLVTVNVTDFAPVEILMKDIKEGQLVDFIVASASFPIFPPKEIEGKKYYDGGLYDNMPINLLARNGYDKMLVIRTNPMSKQPKRKLERDDLNLFFIAPSEDIGPAMAFSSVRVRRFMQMGYEDCKEALNNGLKEFLSGENMSVRIENVGEGI